MKGLVAVSTALALLCATPAAQAGGRLFGSSKDRYDKHCDDRAGFAPGYGSPRCRMEAPLAPGQTQVYIFLGHRFIHVGSQPQRG